MDNVSLHNFYLLSNFHKIACQAFHKQKQSPRLELKRKKLQFKLKIYLFFFCIISIFKFNCVYFSFGNELYYQSVIVIKNLETRCNQCI